MVGGFEKATDPSYLAPLFSRHAQARSITMATRDGDRYSRTTFKRHFVLAKKLVNIERRFRPHDMRHTAACKMVDFGIHMTVISAALGHSNTTITERVYA